MIVALEMATSFPWIPARVRDAGPGSDRNAEHPAPGMGVKGGGDDL